LNHLK